MFFFKLEGLLITTSIRLVTMVDGVNELVMDLGERCKCVMRFLLQIKTLYCGGVPPVMYPFRRPEVEERMRK